MSSDFGGSLYKSFTSSLYLSSNFQLSTVAGIRAMTLHGISRPPCIIGEGRYCVDVNCTSIAAPHSSKYFVVRLYFLWKMTYCMRKLMRACFDCENIERIFTFMATFQCFILWGDQYLLNTYDSNGSPLQHYQPRNSFCHLFSIKSSSENL